MRTSGRGARVATGAFAALLAATLLLALAARAEAYLYWGQAPGSIVRAQSSGGGIDGGFLPGLPSGVWGVHVDDRNLWWANLATRRIGRAARDGSGADAGFIDTGGQAHDVVSDDERVWWTSGGTIGRARRDGSGVTHGFIAGGGAVMLALDDEYVYWTRTSADAIGRARRDGSGVDQSFITGLDAPLGIAVDGEHLYWVNGGSSNAVGRANLDGSGVNQSFVTGLAAGAGLAVDATHVYWVNQATNRVGRANLDGSGVSQSFSGPGDGMADIAVDALPATPTLTGVVLQGAVFAGEEPFRFAVRLAGGSHPTGTLNVRLFGPDDATCSGTPLVDETIAVDGDGDYQAPAFTPLRGGSYRWRASYSGDDANRSLGAGTCGLGTVYLALRRKWSLRATVPSAAAVAGEALSAQATIGAPVCFAAKGGSARAQGWGCFAGPRAAGDPAGSVVFRLYGPGDESCSLPPVFEDAVALSAALGRTARSAPYVPAEAGSYRWTAEYTGDDANDGASVACGEAAVVAVAKATPTLTLTAEPETATAGDALAARAALSGGFEPGGELTFALHGPGDDRCEAAPVHVARAIVGDAAGGGASGGGARAAGERAARATAFAATAPGTYRWVVTYAGDRANAGVATACGDAGAAVVVREKPVDPPPARPAPALSGFTLSGRCTRPGSRGAVTIGLRLRMARPGAVRVKVERALGTRGLARCPAANPNARFGGRFRTVVTRRSVETVAVAGGAARTAGRWLSVPEERVQRADATKGRASAAALARAVTLRLRLEPALYRITVRTRTADGRLSAPRSRFLRVLSPRG